METTRIKINFKKKFLHKGTFKSTDKTSQQQHVKMLFYADERSHLEVEAYSSKRELLELCVLKAGSECGCHIDVVEESVI